MALFDLLKKNLNKGSRAHKPKDCPTDITSEIVERIDSIDWAEYETAYGNAKETIPFYLKTLFCNDVEASMNATHQLWCCLCHQHAYISSAALPSYDILKVGLLQLDNNLKAELLDIFQGFSECTNTSYFSSVGQEPQGWESSLRQKLLFDIGLFEDLTSHSDEEISTFAAKIVEDLTT